MLKKKLVAVLAVVAALTLAAAPVTSYAAMSPNTTTSTTKTDTGVVAGVSSKKTKGDGWIKITPTDEQSSNVPSGSKVITSFKVTEDGTEGPYTYSFEIGPEYAGSTIYIYITYVDGTSEVITKVADANGTVTFTTEKKADTITLVGEKSDGTAASKDTSSRSPQTGVDTVAVTGVTGAAVVATAGVALALRKKVNE